MPAARHILLTGGSSGIGLEAAALLLAGGHRLTVLCRNAEAVARLRQRLDGQLATPIVDLADLTSVEACNTAVPASRVGRPRASSSPWR